MKALMNLAKEKRQEGSSNQSSSITQKSHLNKFAQPPSEMSEQPQDFDEDYEPQVEEIIAYAEFIGIKLPQEEDLLWIAKQGLQTELPPDWQEAETQQGEVAYTNVRTGQIMFEHPCDEYYRQLVIKERKKTPSKMSMKSNISSGFQPIGSVATKSLGINKKQPQPIVDPLVKMQRQKQQKKLQQQKRKQYNDKKQSIKVKYDQKKQKVQRQYKTKQQKAKQRYKQQLQKQRRENMQKMSQQQKQQQRKRQQQIRQFEKQTKEKQQKQLQQRMRKQKQKLQKKYQQKKQQIRIQLQKKLKNQKREIDQYYQQKYKQLQLKQKKIQQQTLQLGTNKQLQQQISAMKSQIIRKKLNNYAQKLKQQTQKQKLLYSQQIQQLQQIHNNKVKQLQQQPNSQSFSLQSNQKLQQLIKQVQSYQKEQLKIFQYQLQVMKQMKQFQIDQKVQQYKSKLNLLHKDKLNNITKQMQKQFDNFKQLQQEHYQNIIIETQKKAKQDFLHSLKLLQKKFIQQEEITLLQNRFNNIKGNNIIEKQNLYQLNRVYQQLQYRQKQLKRQRQSIKLQIQNLRSQSTIANPMIKMNQQQIKLYQLIQNKIKTNLKSN